jgi:hypothetical protein
MGLTRDTGESEMVAGISPGFTRKCITVRYLRDELAEPSCDFPKLLGQMFGNVNRLTTRLRRFMRHLTPKYATRQSPRGRPRAV